MRCVELFAGAGGAALGLEAAGFEHAALCEWDADACATLRAAGLGPVVQGDVRDLDAIAATVGPEPVDLLWSSFPCQAFSTAGKRRGAADERNGWPWTVDAIDRFRPRWFLAENVYGLLTHSTEGHPDPFACPRCYFETVILAQLRERFAHVGWWLLDAADFGVPQHRRRVIIWAGSAPLVPPRRTHGPGMFTRPWVSMAEALGIGVDACGTTGSFDRRQIKRINGPSPTVTISAGRAAPWGSAGVPFVVAAGETGEGRPRTMDRAAPTISGQGNAYLLNTAPTGSRRLTVAECATLQDFPVGHPFQGTKTARYRQVGNAVPPRLAEVVGRAVMDAEGRMATPSPTPTTARLHPTPRTEHG